MFHMWDWGFGIGGILMLGFWLFIAVVAVVVIVLVINSTKQSRDRSTGIKSGPDGAVEKVKERYANGEISREEYLQMLKDLKE